jgi:hypothetical protein
MTTLLSRLVKCARCGTTSHVQTLGSSSSSGYSDLDGRERGRIRSTMGVWLQECPNCFFVARDLSVGTPDEFDVVREIGYIDAALADGMPDRATRFLARAYIDQQTGQFKQAILRLLHTAWVLDDHRIDASAIRRQAADLVLKLGENADPALRLLRLDLLRRAGAFAEAIIAADLEVAANGGHNHIQIALAQKGAAREGRLSAISYSEILHSRGDGEPPLEPIPDDWHDLFD